MPDTTTSPQSPFLDVATAVSFEAEYTPLSEIPDGVARVVSAFHNTQKTHSLQYRLNQLRNVYFILKDNVDNLTRALELDFHRSSSETKIVDIAPAMAELLFIMANLQKWSKPEAVSDLPKSMSSNTVFIERIPYGTILIIAPFNYPFNLSLSPIAGAIAGGNTVVYKPSESTPRFSKLFTDLLTLVLDPDLFYAVLGAIPETTLLLEQKFDKILYTGNNFVGTIVAKKAAETLTPYILELGGKSPAFVLEDVTEKDITTTARRIAWGRFVNGGQTCVAVDYVVVHESVHERLVKELVRIVKEEFYPDDTDITKLIHARSYDNVVKIISQSKGDIVLSGENDPETNFVYPTIIDNVTWDDSTMRGEIFGPVLPILVYKDLKEALAPVQKRHDTPLAQYIFTGGAASRKNPQVDQILTTIRSGGVIINDVIVHVGLPNAPFGGIGTSGSGAYHGYFSFKSFTHERTTVAVPFWNEFSNAPRYPPYNSKKETLVNLAYDNYNGSVWFRRTGNVDVGGPGRVYSLWTGVGGFVNLLYHFAKGV